MTYGWYVKNYKLGDVAMLVEHTRIQTSQICSKFFCKSHTNNSRNKITDTWNSKNIKYESRIYEIRLELLFIPFPSLILPIHFLIPFVPRVLLFHHIISLSKHLNQPHKYPVSTDARWPPSHIRIRPSPNVSSTSKNIVGRRREW
jgi:hypothetical protein